MGEIRALKIAIRVWYRHLKLGQTGKFTLKKWRKKEPFALGISWKFLGNLDVALGALDLVDWMVFCDDQWLLKVL